MVEYGAHNRVSILKHRTARELHAIGEPSDAVAGADHVEMFGLLAKPRPGKVGAGLSFEPFNDCANPVVFVRASRSDHGGAPRPKGEHVAGERNLRSRKSICCPRRCRSGPVASRRLATAWLRMAR
jgi:hypothetical protein